MTKSPNPVPLCEVCGKNPATSFSHFYDQASKHGSWKFCCMCTSGKEDYYIEFSRFSESLNETMDWLAHMDEKKWMDWKDFIDMAHRYRSAKKA
jgi:protein-arginine kinase activator protein McsA